MMNIDLTQLKEHELQAELKRRAAAKENDRKAYKELVNETINPLVRNLKTISRILGETKLYTFKGLKDLLELKQKAYDVKGKQQSHTFTDDEGNSITYGFRVLDNWDDTVSAGIDKVREFITSLAKDEATGKLVHVVNQLLKKDAKGNLKASRVLELTKLAEEFDDPNFTDAVDIIRKAYKPIRSAFFIDVSYTNAQGKKINIPLSMTSVDFPADTNIDELFPVDNQYKI